MTCLIAIRATKCGKTQMNYVLSVDNTNIFHSITLKKVQTSKRPSRELKKKKKKKRSCKDRIFSYLGTIAKLSIKAPCMDQVILKWGEKH